MERRCILFIAPLALALANWLPNGLSAADLEEAKVTQVVQEVKVVPSGAAARPAAVNETVRQGNAVQTGTQSRTELTFRDQTITRLGEKTIYNIGGGRTIDMGSGQFLLYVPKNKGGAKVKMGPVTAAITGTTVLGNVLPSGIVEFTVLEGTACIHLDRVGQTLQVLGGHSIKLWLRMAIWIARSEQRERPASKPPRRTNLCKDSIRSLFVTLRASVARL